MSSSQVVRARKKLLPQRAVSCFIKAMMESVFSSLTSSCKIEMISCIKSHEDWFVDGGMLFDDVGLDTVCWFEAAVTDSDPVKQFIFCF